MEAEFSIWLTVILHVATRAIPLVAILPVVEAPLTGYQSVALK